MARHKNRAGKPDNVLTEGQCPKTRKIRYAGKRQAIKARSGMSGKAKPGGFYRCEHCHGWHLTRITDKKAHAAYCRQRRAERDAARESAA